MKRRIRGLTANRPASFYWFLIFAFLFSIQVIPKIRSDSPVNDEMLDIATGYWCWHGNITLEPSHPPFLKALLAFPLVWMPLHSDFNPKAPNFQSQVFCFFYLSNPAYFEMMLTASRWITLAFFGWGVGLVLFKIARSWSFIAFLSVMTFWAFDPTFLAYSGLDKADVPLAFFLLAAVLCFRKSGKKPKPFFFLLTGILSGMAVTSKFTALATIPIFVILDIFALASHKKDSTSFWRVIRRKWVWGAFGFIFWVSGVYLPGTLNEAGHLQPLAYFLQGIFKHHLAFQQTVYFRGVLDGRNHLSYYPLVLLFKSPLPFVVFFALGLILMGLRRLKLPLWQWLPGIVYFICMIVTPNMGARYLLPSFPFFFMLASRSAAWLWEFRLKNAPLIGKWLTAGLLLVQVFSVAFSFPHHISYFNELIPKSRRLYWLGDSNFDIGQDTKRLAETAREKGWNHIKLAYFGNVDPSLYAMKWDYWTQKDLSGPQPGWIYAVNAAFLQLGPAFIPQAPAILNSWITRHPADGMAGDTWYYFEIPGQISLNDHSPSLASAPLFDYYRRFYSFEPATKVQAK